MGLISNLGLPPFNATITAQKVAIAPRICPMAPIVFQKSGLIETRRLIYIIWVDCSSEKFIQPATSPVENNT